MAEAPRNVHPCPCLAELIVVPSQRVTGTLEDGHGTDHVALPVGDRTALGHQSRPFTAAQVRLSVVEDAEGAVELAEPTDDERQAHLDPRHETSISNGEGEIGGPLQGLARWLHCPRPRSDNPITQCRRASCHPQVASTAPSRSLASVAAGSASTWSSSCEEVKPPKLLPIEVHAIHRELAR